MQMRWLPASLTFVALASACAPATCEPVFTGPPDLTEPGMRAWEEIVSDFALPLCVRKIAFVDEIQVPNLDHGGVIGGKATRTLLDIDIQVISEPYAYQWRPTLVHELCHAVSFQHGLAKGHPPLPYGSGVAPARLQEELFARWCDLGALAPHLLEEARDLAPDEAETLAWMREIWSTPPGMPEPPVLLDGVELVMPVPLGARPLRGFRADGAVVLEPQEFGANSVVVDFDLEIQQQFVADREMYARSPVPGPGFLRGLEPWRLPDDWIPWRDWRIGRIHVELPSEQAVEVTLAVSTDDGRGPLVLQIERSVRGRVVELVGGPDGVVVQTAYEPDTWLLQLWSWDLGNYP